MKRSIVFLWVVVGTLGSMLAACAPFTGVKQAKPSYRDGLVFEGSAADVPGSFGRLVLEKNFVQTQRLRWESSDTRIGSTEVDFFQPRNWLIEGDPPAVLKFLDRSPGPVLGGRVWLGSINRADVSVVLGNDRIRYTLNRVERDGSR